MKASGFLLRAIAFVILFLTSHCTIAGVEFVSLHSFSVSGDNGILPEAGLTSANDGNFYGTTKGIRMNGGGRRIKPTAFRMSPSGYVTTIAWFDDLNTYPATNVIRDEVLTSELLLGEDGNLYGVAQMGGHVGYGRVFKMTLEGKVTTIHSFEGYYGTNGWAPAGGLIEGPDEWFYGTAGTGGIKERTDSAGMGTIYKVNRAGELQTLFYFRGTNGEFPACTLALGKDGCLYGTTPYGGPAYTTAHPSTVMERSSRLQQTDCSLCYTPSKE